MFEDAKTIVAGKSRSVTSRFGALRVGLSLAAAIGVATAVAGTDLRAEPADAVLQRATAKRFSFPRIAWR